MEYQSINVGDRARRGFPPATLPELVWITVADLRLDPSYQRPIEKHGWAHIQRIADEFDWGRFSPLIVAPLPDGTYAVVDGQHRAHAAALRMIERVPALSVALDRRGQARAFATINGAVTRVTLFHLYRAALAAEEEWALACCAAVDRAGCRLMLANASTASKKPFQIYSVGMIRDHVASGRGEAVTRALSALRRIAEAQISTEFWQDTILRPWITLCARYPSISVETLAELGAQMSLPKVYRRAAQMRLEPQGRGQTQLALMTEILNAMTENWVATGNVRQAPGPRVT